MTISLGIAYLNEGLAVDQNGELIYFSSEVELKDSCIWITDQTDQIIKTKFAGRYRFKSSHYFSRHLQTIIADLGLSNLPLPNQLRLLQGLLSWCFEVTAQYNCLPDKDSDRLFTISSKDIRHKVLSPIAAIVSQRYCNLASPNHQESFVLYTAPTKLHKSLTNIRYPESGFSLSQVHGIEADLMALDSHYVLAKLHEKYQIDLILSLPYLNMKSRANSDGLWLTLPEYQKISLLLNVSLKANAVITAKQFSKVRSASLDKDTDKKQRVKESASYSIFLVFESLIGSLIGSGKRKMSFAEIYLSSIIRINDVRNVINLQEKGYEVQGYGGGKIALKSSPLNLPSEDKKEFLETIFGMGLFPPTADFGVAADIDKDTPAGTFFNYASAGDSDSLYQLNHYLLESK